ncbi:hypothetical protein MtrunA17_Chr7g0225771 [Medicago truncatula]|nr:hypothetical protein MtrunA17_Chr7g0225771 [Medicago truncatula]
MINSTSALMRSWVAKEQTRRNLVLSNEELYQENSVIRDTRALQIGVSGRMSLPASQQYCINGGTYFLHCHVIDL